MATRTATERLLLRLEWQVLRRLDGRIAGGYRTAHRGGGIDLAGLRDYVEGDDARHIDWNVTARLNEPQLRVFNEDRELTVWLVLDRSASMTVGAPGRGKHEVLSELALVIARLFTRGGNRVGALLYDTGLYDTGPHLRHGDLRDRARPYRGGAYRAAWHRPDAGAAHRRRTRQDRRRGAGARRRPGRRPLRPPRPSRQERQERQERQGRGTGTAGTGPRAGAAERRTRATGARTEETGAPPARRRTWRPCSTRWRSWQGGAP